MSSLAAYASYFEPDTRYNKTKEESHVEDTRTPTEEGDVKDVIRMLHTAYADETSASQVAPVQAQPVQAQPAQEVPAQEAPAPHFERYEEALEGFAQPEHDGFAPLWPEDQDTKGAGAGARDVRRLLNKMDHILHLIEDNHAGTNVTEELILYCFLGIFVIFLVDAFLHAGKTYHR